MVKNYTLIKRKDGLTHEEFLRYWKDVHGPIAVRLVPGLRKYIQGHAIGTSGGELDIDGIAELWFDNMEAIQNYAAWRKTDAAKELLEDEDKFIDKSRFIRVFAQEQVILGK